MEKNQKNRILLPLLLVCAVALYGGFVVAASAQELSNAVVARRERLKAELQKIEKEIGAYRDTIRGKQKEAASLERDISVLDAQINKAQLQIRAINIELETLQDRIDVKESNIGDIVAKVNREKMSLGEVLRTMNEYDDFSVIEILLAYDSVSDFMREADSIDIVQRTLQDSFEELRGVKAQEENARDNLISEKSEQRQLRALAELEKQGIEKKKAERRRILKVTRGEESAYQALLASRKKSAASIRSQLFLLQGSPAISFEKAVLYAEKASAKTGVRPAFILGVIAQESELGRNIGQCNLPDDPPKYRWRAIMKPSRDYAPYLDITRRLGLDPDLMPLSCPMSVGWGGAMGPSQFIPSTWVLFEDRIAKATGNKPPSPWNAEDAFMATGIYISDLGGNAPAGELKAAGRYFAGSRWNTPLGRTYANQVLSKVNTYQKQLNILAAE